MNVRKIALSVIFFIVVIIGIYFSGLFDSTPLISIDINDRIIFTNKKVSPNEEKVILCIPAAYSGKNGIIGHYSMGQGRQGRSDFRYTTVYLDNNTYFQQASLVKSHVPKTFFDDKKRYRRALCKKDGKFFIVHSKLPQTLDSFACQLTEYDRAWNLDMGSFAYGWYRDYNGNMHHLGLSTYWNKEKQTNWIVVYKK